MSVRRKSGPFAALLALTGAALGAFALAGSASAAPPELDIQSTCVGAHGQLIVEVRNTSPDPQTLTVTSVPDLVNDTVTLAGGVLSEPYTLNNVPDQDYVLTVTTTDTSGGPSSSPVTVACAADESGASASLEASRNCDTGDVTGDVDVSGVRASAGNGAVPYHGQLDVYFNNAVVGSATLVGGQASIPITANLDPTQTVFATSIESPASDNDDISFNGTFILPACRPAPPASSTPVSSSPTSSPSSLPASVSTGPTTAPSTPAPTSTAAPATSSASSSAVAVVSGGGRTLATTGVHGLRVELTLALGLVLLGAAFFVLGRRPARQH